MELAYKYSYIGKTICLAVFYLPIFPLGVVIAFFGLFIMYLIEKYNVLYHYKRPEKIDGQITRAYISTFRVVIFIYAISVYVFLGNIYENETKWELIAIILFGILVLLPYGSLLVKVGMFQVSTFSNDKYEDLYFEMGMNYAMANPLTKTKGFETYLDRLRQKNMITDDEYTEHIRKIQTAPSDIIELYYKKKYGKLKKTKNIFKGLLKNSDYTQGKNLKNDKNYLKRLGTGANKNQIFGINFDSKPSNKNPIKGFGGIVKIQSSYPEKTTSNLNYDNLNNVKAENNVNLRGEVKEQNNSNYEVKVNKDNSNNDKYVMNHQIDNETPYELQGNHNNQNFENMKNDAPYYD